MEPLRSRRTVSNLIVAGKPCNQAWFVCADCTLPAIVQDLRVPYNDGETTISIIGDCYDTAQD